MRLIVFLVAFMALAWSPETGRATPSVNSEDSLIWKADRIVVRKHERLMLLFRDDRVIAMYRVSLGRNPVGRKRFQGDGRTPEGTYVIDGRNPRSRFHRALHISYPNSDDNMHARMLGASPGGAIMIHGQPSNGRRDADWTEGCIAVSNSAMDEIWMLVDDGTPILIHP